MLPEEGFQSDVLKWKASVFPAATFGGCMGFTLTYSKLPWESRGASVFKVTGLQFLVRKINTGDFVNQPLSVHGEDCLPLMF